MMVDVDVTVVAHRIGGMIWDRYGNPEKLQKSGCCLLDTSIKAKQRTINTGMFIAMATLVMDFRFGDSASKTLRMATQPMRVVTTAQRPKRPWRITCGADV